MNLEIAIREKYRFNFKGSLSVEDLYDLKEKDLSDLYGTLAKEKKESKEESLIQTRSTKADKELENKLAIIKHVFETKRSERLEAKNAADNKAELEKLLTIKAERNEEATKNLSDEDLDAKIAELSGQETA